MKYCILMCLLGTFVHLSIAGSAIQTDWAGGPGVLGPVTDWGNDFHIGSDLDWDTTPGQLSLVINANEKYVALGYSGALHVFTIDMDLDGDEDIVGVASIGDEVTWWENADGGGNSWTEHLIGVVDYPMFVYAADLDLDGDRDVVVSSSADDVIYWFANNGGGTSWVKNTLTSGFDARQVICAFIDTDAYPDIVAVSSATGDVCWWKNRLGSGQLWVQNYIDGGLMGAYAVCADDFNLDGKTDVIATSYTTGSVYYYQNTGSGWQKNLMDSSLSGAISVTSGNLDANSRPEVVAMGYIADDIVMYKFESAGVWTKYTVDSNFNGAISAEIADVDNDGYNDIIACARVSDDVAWYKNLDGTGFNYNKVLVEGNFDGARAVNSADIDGNGAVDIVACAEYASKVSWWNITGFTTPGYCTSSIHDNGPSDNYWEYILFNYYQPYGTSVKFKLRSSNDWTNMGSWSLTWITDPGSIVGMLTNNDRYMQYRAVLETTNPVASPGLEDILIYWSYDDIGDATSPVDEPRMVWVVGGNPVHGAFTISYTVTEPGPVELVIYDMSGRTVSQLVSGDMESGSYMASVPELPAGTYACGLQAPGYWAIERLVVLP